MNILIDIGNSCLKWALHDGTLWTMQRYYYNKAELDNSFDQAWRSLPPLKHAYVANVAGAVIETRVADWFKTRHACAVTFARSAAKTDTVRSAYSEPEALGVDRWLALLGAARLYPHSGCLVVDCGTAITLDALTADGEHWGGWIAPGLDLMRQSLHSGTRALPRLEQDAWPYQPFALGKNTHQCMNFGTVYAATALIEKMTLGLAAQWTQPPVCILTGGASERLAPLLQFDVRLVPDLVLQGLETCV
jgi:type III pantothenate kinase